MSDLGANEILDTLMKNLKQILSTKTIVGDPIQVGKTTILPVMKVSLGFGAGAGSPGSSGQTKGGGGGGGIVISPVGFPIVEEGKAMMITPTSSRWDWIVESIPDLWDKLRKGGKKTSPPEDTAETPETK